MVSQDLRVPVLLLDEASGEEAHDRGEEGETAPHRRHEELTDEIFGHLRPPRHTTSSSDSSSGDSKTKPMRGSSSRSLSASWSRRACTSARRSAISLRIRRKNTVIPPRTPSWGASGVGRSDTPRGLVVTCTTERRPVVFTAQLLESQRHPHDYADDSHDGNQAH